MPVPLIVSTVSGLGALALAIFAVWDWLLNRADTRPDVGESIFDRGDQDDATEAELFGFAEQLHRIRIAPSPLLHRVLDAMDEHEPMSWPDKQRVFADYITWMRRRARALGRPTQAMPVVTPRERIVRPVITYTPPRLMQPALPLRLEEASR